jgi:alkanesulfonate monooxygenase SsuD/methylene tetrahydromethanopterin reductase-like flavin-dependent oxidoreductase (luciferase family)
LVSGALRYSLFTDMRNAPGTPPTPEHYDRIVELVQLAEELGYHTVWTTEQHAVDDGYLPTHLPVLSAFARETNRIRVGSGVILLPLTQFRRVVEEACVVDMLSHGRLTLGVGAGHHPHEFQAYGVSLKDRARLMEEGLQFLRPGLAGENLPDGLPVNVPPAQSPIPLVVGGVVAPAVDRAVRLADGHFAYAYVDPDTTLPAQWRERIAPSMERHEKSPGDFQLIFTSIVWASDDYRDEWKDYVYPAFLYQQQRYAEWAGDVPLPEGLLGPPEGIERLRQRMLIGTPNEIVERLNAIRAVYPFHEIVIWPQLPGVPYELADKCLRTFATEVAPRIDNITAA